HPRGLVMDDRSEMNRHVAAAIREIDLALDSGDCGVCADLLGQERAHLEMFRDLSGKVSELVVVQERVTDSFAEGNRKADVRLVEAGARPPVSARPGNGLGVVDMVSEMWRTRVRVADVLSVGGRR
ncbi:MAG: hypothetical protein ACRDWE_11465, partial [Acidimicrobiales bacterium]